MRNGRIDNGAAGKDIRRTKYHSGGAGIILHGGGKAYRKRQARYIFDDL